MAPRTSIVGLHQTTDWDAAAITSFAPDMAARIKPHKPLGIHCQEVAWIQAT